MQRAIGLLLQTGWHLLDNLVPGFPGAAAVSPDSASDTCTGTACAGNARSLLLEPPLSLGTFIAKGRQHFHFHVGTALGKRTQQQALTGSLIILARDTRSVAEGPDEWGHLIRQVVRRDDLLFRELDHAWLGPATTVAAPEGKNWSIAGQAIDGSRYRTLRKQARRKMATLLEMMQTALLSDLCKPADFWSRDYAAQLEFLKREDYRIQIAPNNMIAPHFNAKEYARNYVDFVAANAEYEKEEEEVFIKRCTHLVTEVLQSPGRSSANKVVLMDAELVRRIGIALLSRFDTLVVTDRRWPIKLDATVGDRPPTTLRFLKETIESIKGRVLISPRLLERTDQSLSGTLVLLADEEHDNFDLQWQTVKLVQALSSSSDKILVELPDDQRPNYFDCLTKPDDCHAIEDAASRKAILPEQEKCRAAVNVLLEHMKAGGWQDLVTSEQAGKMTLHQLIRTSRQLSLLVRDSRVPASSREKLSLLDQAWADYLDKSRKLDKVRERVMAQRMKQHLFKEGACFGSIGAVHLQAMQQQILDELPAIIIWPDFPGTVWAGNRGH